MRTFRASFMLALALPRGALGGLESYTRTGLDKLLRELSLEEVLEVVVGRFIARFTPAVLHVDLDPRRVAPATQPLEAEAASA